MKKIISQEDLSSIFNKFVGTEIRRPSDYQPIKTEAEKHGFTLRSWLPDTMGTMDYVPNRLNIYIEKDEKNTLRIINKFELG